MIEALVLLTAGLAISLIVMAVGIGGGLLWTPLLILSFGLPPQEAVAASLMIQVAGLGSGSLAYWRTRLVRKRLVAILFLAALPGVLIGSFLGVQLPQQMVQMALGVISLTVAILFVSAAAPFPARHDPAFDRRRLLEVLPIPGFFGFAMGLLSVGISEWLVPTLRGRLGLSMPEAVATVIPVMFALAVVASLSHGLLAQTLHWEAVFWGGSGTLVGGQLGPRLAQRINEGLLKDSFIYLMTLVGIHLIFQAV